jgi:hypothetical protein
MKQICRRYLLLVAVFSKVLITGCKPKEQGNFTTFRSYEYTIKASVANLGGGAQFELVPAFRRKNQYKNISNDSVAVMYAYYQASRYKGSKWVVDTEEVAVSKQQADRLFKLAKAVFDSTLVSDVDTVYTGLKEPTIFEEDSYPYGEMALITHYSNIQLKIGDLRPDQNQSVPFITLYKEFEELFDERL